MRPITFHIAALSLASLAINPVFGQTSNLQGIVEATSPLPKATLYIAKEVVTLDPSRPPATAVAVVGDRIVAAGSLEELKAADVEQVYEEDATFADKVIVPGFRSDSTQNRLSHRLKASPGSCPYAYVTLG